MSSKHEKDVYTSFVVSLKIPEDKLAAFAQSAWDALRNENPEFDELCETGQITLGEVRICVIDAYDYNMDFEKVLDATRMEQKTWMEQVVLTRFDEKEEKPSGSYSYMGEMKDNNTGERFPWTAYSVLTLPPIPE